MKSLSRSGFPYHSRVLEVLISLQRSITLSFYRTGGRYLSFYIAAGAYRPIEQDVLIIIQSRRSLSFYRAEGPYRSPGRIGVLITLNISTVPIFRVECSYRSASAVLEAFITLQSKGFL